MTVRELIDLLDSYSDKDIPVVAYTPDGENVADVLVKTIYAESSFNFYNKRTNQLLYEIKADLGGNEVLLISV